MNDLSSASFSRPRGMSENPDTQLDPLGVYTVDLFDCPPFLMFHWDDCHRAHNILEQRSFEPMSMSIWCKLARHATAIIDIGAQVGVYSLAAAALRPDLAIHAFEPNPDAYARLALHQHMNGSYAIRCHREALGCDHGVAPLSWVRKGALISSGGSLGLREGCETVPVMVRALDSYEFDLGDRGLIKIDVEGAEAAVLAGAIQTITKYRPSIILETFDQANCDAWNEVIAPLNYKIHKVIESECELVTVENISPCDKTSGDFNQWLSPA